MPEIKKRLLMMLSPQDGMKAAARQFVAASLRGRECWTESGGVLARYRS